MFILIEQHIQYMKNNLKYSMLIYACEYLGILQENTLKRLQGNIIKTVMGIGKNCSTTPLLNALNLSHIPSIEL